ncbi:MAG: hypothetical protein U0791_06935 [Gemmataceae bacterium]
MAMEDSPYETAAKHRPAVDWGFLGGAKALGHLRTRTATIQFIRYAKMLQAKGASVLADCQEPLAELGLPGNRKVVPRGSAVPPHDLSIPLLSLPGLLGVPPESATADVPYLHPDPDRVEHWRRIRPGLKVGIAWQGSKVHRGDQLPPSSPPTRFAPGGIIPGVTLFQPAKGPGTEQLSDEITNPNGVGLDLGGIEAADMEDTAAVIMNLDLVVTVDTAIAHVAGAIARPVWVAVAAASDWRWLQNRDDSPWYPTLLFPPACAGDWDSLFGRLAVALAEWARRASSERVPGTQEN